MIYFRAQLLKPSRPFLGDLNEHMMTMTDADHDPFESITIAKRIPFWNRSTLGIQWIESECDCPLQDGEESFLPLRCYSISLHLLRFIGFLFTSILLPPSTSQVTTFNTIRLTSIQICNNALLERGQIFIGF